MSSPFAKLYDLIDTVISKFPNLLGIKISALLVFVTLGSLWLFVGVLLNIVFPVSIITGWLNKNWYWPVGATVALFSVYFFVRNFFQTTTTKSDAEAKAWRSCND